MSIFTRLQQLPLRLNNYYPKPSHHPTKKNTIIISTDYESFGESYDISISGIYEYNVETNELHQIQYRYGEIVEEHGQFIDSKNHKLYLFGGSDDCFITLDLESNELQCDHSILRSYILIKPITANIASPINETHIIGYKTHFKYKYNTQSIEKLDISHSDNPFISFISDDDECMERPHLIYIPIKQQLMIFGCNKDKRIWHCHIKQHSNQRKYEWKLNVLTMPYSNQSHRYDILLAFQCILFVFYFAKKRSFTDHVEVCRDIWCLDLKYDEWFKSQYQNPSQTQILNGNIDHIPCNHVIKNGNNAHILNFDKQYHFKVNLYDIIPNELIKQHIIKHNEPLIMGYFKEKQNEYDINIPLALKRLILTYYPTFI